MTEHSKIKHLNRKQMFNIGVFEERGTVVPTKSDSDVIFCLQLYTPLELTRIDISFV